MASTATKLGWGGVVAVLLILTGLLIWQQGRMQRLQAEQSVLRQQLELRSLVQKENQDLKTQLSELKQRAQEERNELLRLRADVTRLKQVEEENRRLQAERDRLARQPPPTPMSEDPVSDQDTPEWRVVDAGMRFSKALGLAIHTYANGHDGQLPVDLTSLISSLPADEFAEFVADQIPADDPAYELIRNLEFELVFHGRFEDLAGRGADRTILAWQKQPVQLSNGRWARACVFGDGSAMVLAADSLEALAAKEAPLLPPADSP